MTGGLLVIGGRTNYYTVDATWLGAAQTRLEGDGKIELLERALPEEKFIMDKDALILVYKVV